MRVSRPERLGVYAWGFRLWVQISGRVIDVAEHSDKKWMHLFFGTEEVFNQYKMLKIEVLLLD